MASRPSKTPAYKSVLVDKLIPYARNSRTHSPEQVSQIAASIKEFGFINPVIIDGDRGIIAGHGRVLAAQKLDIKELPCIEVTHLTDAQRRAYVIAYNKLALNAGWDDELLKIELGELAEEGFDLELTGFSLEEFDLLGMDEDHIGDDDKPENYSREIEIPIYEPKGDRPQVGSLYNQTKADELKSEIIAAKLPDEVRDFMIAAAERHTVFDFRNIAEFYAHTDVATQSLMERSALVIVDIDQAIESGFVHLSKEMMAHADISKAADDEG